MAVTYVRTKSGPVAQPVEQRTHNPLVPGSNPGGPTCDSGKWVVKRFSIC